LSLHVLITVFENWELIIAAACTFVFIIINRRISNLGWHPGIC